MQKIISIANQKGGVGKTTTAFNVAARLVKAGKKVLCIDFDPQGNLSEYLGYDGNAQITMAGLMTAVVAGQPVNPSEAVVKSSEGIEYIAADISLASADLFLAGAFMREQVLKQVLSHESLSEYDYIIIDCLPSLGILLTNALTASTDIIIPVQTQKFAFDGLNALMQMYKIVKSRINHRLNISGILLTMTDNTNMSKNIEKMKSDFDDMVFKTKIKRSVEAANSSEAQKSLISQKNSKLGVQYNAKLLTPSADIKICGFEQADYPDNFFDVAITNGTVWQY